MLSMMPQLGIYMQVGAYHLPKCRLQVAGGGGGTAVGGGGALTGAAKEMDLSSGASATPPLAAVRAVCSTAAQAWLCSTSPS